MNTEDLINVTKHPALQKTRSLIKKYKRYGLIIIGALGYYIYKSSTATTVVAITPQDLHTVKSGSITNTIKVIGTTKITDQQTLTFAQEGTVSKVYVKQGQTVKKGDLLAEIDKKDLKNDIAQQSLSIQNARLSYQKLLGQYTDADKAQAQNNIDTTQNKLTIAQKDLQNMLAEKSNNLQTSATNIQTFLLSLKSSVSDSKTILQNIDQIFGFTSQYKYTVSDYIIYLSAKTSSEKDSTETAFNQATTKLNELQSYITMISTKSTTTLQEIESLQTKNKDLLNTLSTLTNHAKVAIDNSIEASSLSLSQINSRSSAMNSAKSKVLSLLSSANSDTKSLQSTESDIQNKKSEIKNYETQLIVYKQALQDIIRGPKSEDRLLQSNNIKQSQISLSKLSEKSDDYELRAPFDGNIDVLSLKKGDNITMDNISEKTITVSNPDFFEIDMLIDQVDIVKIDKGMAIEATFDAYPGYVATGTISIIDPTPTTNAGVVSYTAKIYMSKGQKKIYDGMTTTVKIITEKKDDIIIIPTSAIQTINNTTAVQVIKGRDLQNPVVQNIEVGITDGKNSEITSGLNLGQKILLKSYKVTTTTKTTTQTQDGRTTAQQSTKGLGVGGNNGGGRPDF